VLENESEIRLAQDSLVYSFANTVARFTTTGEVTITMHGNIVYEGRHGWNARSLRKLFKAGECAARKQIATYLLGLRPDGLPLITDTYVICDGKWSFQESCAVIGALMTDQVLEWNHHANASLTILTATENSTATFVARGAWGEYMTIVDAVLQRARPWGMTLVEEIHNDDEDPDRQLRTHWVPQPYQIHVERNEIPVRLAAMAMPRLIALREECGISRKKLVLPDNAIPA
jgi:hypothetical protein